jgi:hypothetical protein
MSVHLVPWSRILLSCTYLSPIHTGLHGVYRIERKHKHTFNRIRTEVLSYSHKWKKTTSEMFPSRNTSWVCSVIFLRFYIRELFQERHWECEYFTYSCPRFTQKTVQDRLVSNKRVRVDYNQYFLNEEVYVWSRSVAMGRTFFLTSASALPHRENLNDGQ